MRRLWNWVWQRGAPYRLGVIFGLGGIAGIIFWGGFNTAMEYTNRLEFCVSCHEMAQTVYPEYQQSVHYKNASGVRVICSDCHVPKDWTAKLVRKIRATNELFHHMAGTIDTPEKFADKRRELAERVWAEMRANNSRECRNCHSYEAMNHEKQTQRANEKMVEAAKKGETCIECHQGIAHKKPFSAEELDR